MKYVFNVKEVSYGHIEVIASTLEEAKSVAEEQYHAGNTVWSGGEYEIENNDT